jgi:hypothetical protein
VIISDIQRNSTEIIRVEVSEFKGRELINVRIWYSSIDQNTGDQVYKPTQKGFALNIEKFGELKEAINRLEQFINDRNSGIQPEQFEEAAHADAETEDIIKNEYDDNKK